MKEREKTLSLYPARLKAVADSIWLAMEEARTIQEVAVGENFPIQMKKVNSALEQAKKEVATILRQHKKRYRSFPAV